MTSNLTRSLSAFAMMLVLFVAPAMGQITVSTPEVNCAASESIVVPVTVSELTGQGAIAFSFRLAFDPSKITITNADKDNTLSAAYNVIANPKESEILVSAASAQPLSGAGTLVNLLVTCNEEGSSPLTFSKFTFNEGQPSADVSNGLVVVEEESGEVQINIQINPNDVFFGELTVGESLTRTISISNLGTSGAPLSGEVALSASSASVFTIVSGGGSFELEAGEAHEVIVSFDPTEEGDFTATLEVTHNATSVPGPSTIDLQGSAQGVPAAPNVVVEQSSLDLGEVVVYREVTGSVTIQNTGNAALSGTVEIAGADAADFALASASDFTVEAGGSVAIEVTFAPVVSGDKEAELRVTHDAENATSPIVVSLTGSALENVAAEQMNEVPGDFRLAQNFPNPFNPQTTLAFGLPNSGRVRLSVFDLTGRELSVLVDSVMPAGWHTVNFDASNLPSGTYLYHMRAESHTLTRKMTVLK